MLRITILVAFLIALFTSCQPNKGSADMIIFGGPIYTLTDEYPQAEAIAVRGNRIMAVGAESEIRALAGKTTQMIDLAGKMLTPGFIEGHGHFMNIGYNELNLDLMDARTFDEIVSRVAEAASKAKPGEWIIGRGWHQDKWDFRPDTLVKGFPIHNKLSAVTPNNPVFLTHASGHAGFANSRAMEMAGVQQLSIEQPSIGEEEGGEILRDALGNPTGLFSENAMDLIEKVIPKNSPERDRQALSLAFDACLRNGITSFHDAGATRNEIELYHTFKEEGNLRVRLYVMITGWDPDLVYESMAKGPVIDSTGWLTVRAVKLNCDGALGSRGAWMLEPYTDRPGHYGMPTLSMDTVYKIAVEGLKHGFQICSHAIGDRANREVLDRYAMAFETYPEFSSDHRFRIEHAQHLNPTDIPRFAALGVIPAMQAIHMSSDRPWAIDRLGEQRIREGTYVWQSILATGAKIVNGTDAPVEPVSPIASFYSSITRKTLRGEPEGGYEPEQKMTREQALRSYTIDAAYGAFEEDMKGSLQPGKLADFTIFSSDLMTIPEEEILGVNVSMVFVDGKLAYQKP
jgi:predicted amidohydrolase YtcJ